MDCLGEGLTGYDKYDLRRQYCSKTNATLVWAFRYLKREVTMCTSKIYRVHKRSSLIFVTGYGKGRWQIAVRNTGGLRCADLEYVCFLTCSYQNLAAFAGWLMAPRFGYPPTGRMRGCRRT